MNYLFRWLIIHHDRTYDVRTWYADRETVDGYPKSVVVAIATDGRSDGPPVDGVRRHGGLPTRFRRDRRAFRTHRDHGFPGSVVATTPKLCARRGPDARRPDGLAFTTRKTDATRTAATARRRR
ncbi:hypothetical protein FWK35_00011949 [Aphis craccivora]|uniref:Uncharacterized protein n=1 Tax=Aphis craccivora TaxID=307492 RepID=A0A6G0YLV0_APHCR|nr:hypothetical protein FWK35_00011949 [Aphis craccivora]